MEENGFQLIDYTGKPTSWGKWDPANINGNRAFSDGRGVQSVEVLAMLAAALNATATAADPGGNPVWQVRAPRAWLSFCIARAAHHRL